MQFHPSGTTPTHDAEIVFRDARWHLMILLAIFWSIPVFWWKVHATWIAYACGALAALLTLPMLASWRRRGRPDNWVLAIHRDGLWVNLRSCEFGDAPAGDTVAFIPYSEMSAVRKTVHRYTTANSDSEVTHHRSVYADIQITSPDASQFLALLQADRRRSVPSRSYFGGVVSVSSGRINRQPVDFLGNDLLRVKFSAGNFALRPRIGRFLRALGQYVRVGDELKIANEHWRDLDDADFDQLVHDLVRDGQDVKAIQSLKSRRGMSTTQAHAFVEELRRQLATPDAVARDVDGAFTS
ncbi:MAG: hypothetical protein KDA61_04600 [Planctomycetales bacterium]|nr:hypothetical protein [Planctomycetales bacterium]